MYPAGMSSSTTQKYQHFVSEPMGSKLVTELPGTGPALGHRLSEAGFSRASIVLGQFLSLNRDRARFVNWLKGICSANSEQARLCYMGLQTWCDNHL